MICRKCNQEKPLGEFYASGNLLKQRVCRVCHGLDISKWSKANPEHVKARADKWLKKNVNKVRAKSADGYRRRATAALALELGTSATEVHALRALRGRYKNADPRAKRLHRNVKLRAHKMHIAFDLTPLDIPLPSHCPVLGIELTYGDAVPKPSTASLDRIDSNIGYVPSNVATISFRANTLKRDGSLHELRAIVSYIEQHTTNLPTSEAKQQ